MTPNVSIKNIDQLTDFEKLQQEEMERELNNALIDKILLNAFNKNKDSIKNKFLNNKDFLLSILLSLLAFAITYALLVNQFLFFGFIFIFITLFFFLITTLIIKYILNRDLENFIRDEMSKVMGFYISDATPLNKKGIDNFFLFISILEKSDYSKFISKLDIIEFIYDYKNKNNSNYNYTKLSQEYLNIIKKLTEHFYERSCTENELYDKIQGLKEKREKIIKKTLFNIKE